MLFFALGDAFSQNLIVNLISVNEGLPSSEVYDIIQDQKGFIWIASDNGLARYDGKQFKIFTKKSGLPSNSVLNIFEDHEGKIWFKTLNGKIAYIESDSVVEYNYTIKEDLPMISTLSNPGIAGFDEEGKKWIAANNKNYVFKEVEKDVYQTIHHDSTANADNIYFIKELQNNHFVYYHAPVSEKFKSFDIQKKDDLLTLHIPESIEEESIFNIFQVEENTFFAINTEGSYVWFHETTILDEGKLPPVKVVMSVLKDSNGDFWITTTNGVFFFRNSDLHQPPQHFFKGQIIPKVIEDKEGVFWFLDHNEGVYAVLSSHFKHLNFGDDYDQKKIVCLRTKNNQLWFSTKKGEIWRIDSTFQCQLMYTEAKKPYDFYPFEVLDGNTLFLPGASLVYPSGQTEGDFNRSNYTGYKTIRSFKDKIYVAFIRGVLKISLNEKKSNKERLSIHNYELNRRTNDIYVEDDRIWIGATNGLNLIENDTAYDLSRTHPLLSNRIMFIRPFRDDYLILGTKGAGILIYHKTNQQIKQIDNESGLVSDMVKSVFVKNNDVYVGTSKGISIIQLDGNMNLTRIKNFDTQNALPSNEVNDIAFCYDKIWLATNKGLVYIDAEKLDQQPHIAPGIYINHVLINDSLIKPSDQSITLPLSVRDITFHFSDISFRAKNKVNYKFYLEGATQDTTFSNIAKASFTNLAPGNYVFNVWAKSENEIWSAEPAQFSFTIPKKLTETVLFKIILAFLILLLFGFVSFLIYRNMRNKHVTKIQTINLKQQALTALMNPHFIHNSLAAIQYFIHQKDYDKSSIYLTQFSSLVRLNLSAIRDGSIFLEDEIERLKLYLNIEKMRFGDKLNYQIMVNEEIDVFDIEIPSMLLQPFVENAIRHGILPLNKPGNILIRFNLSQDQFLEVFIEDDGVGINNSEYHSKDKSHTSVSVNLTKERLALFSQQSARNYQIKIDPAIPETGEGTLVYLKVPIGDE